MYLAEGLLSLTVPPQADTCTAGKSIQHYSTTTLFLNLTANAQYLICHAEERDICADYNKNEYKQSSIRHPYSTVQSTDPSFVEMTGQCLYSYQHAALFKGKNHLIVKHL